MSNQFPNDDAFDAHDVVTEPTEPMEPTEPQGPDAADRAVDETLGDGGSITDPLLVGASGPDGAGTGMGGPMDGEDVASEDVQSSLRPTAPDQERSAAADSPDATIPTAAGGDIPSGARDGGDS